MEIERIVRLKGDSRTVGRGGHEIRMELFWPISGFELEGSMIGVDCDSGLRGPRERFSETVVNAAKKDTPESKRIIDSPVLGKVTFNSIVPSLDTWMEAVPPSVEAFSL